MVAVDTPTKVHPQETKPPLAERFTPWGTRVASTDPVVLFRHRGWERRRAAVRQALELSATRPRQIERFDLCGSDPWVVQDPDDPDRLAVHVQTCHSRWCQPCASARAHTISVNLRNRIGRNIYRFLTLTMKANERPLAEQLDRIYDCFRTLRKTAFWKTHVYGGACSLECKKSTRSTLWHPHLHVLVYGRYIPKATLERHWMRITGDSFICDIGIIRQASKAAHYITKYVAKPVTKTISLNKSALAELFDAYRSRRSLLTFGTWRGFRLTKPLDDTAWKQLAPLQTYLDGADLGIEADKRMLTALFASNPRLIALFIRSPPQIDSP